MFAFMVWSVVLFFSVIKVLTFPQTIYIYIYNSQNYFYFYIIFKYFFKKNKKNKKYIYNASETRVFGLRQVHVKVHRKISSHILFFFFQVHMF
jgi:hypothetical protein